MSFTLIFMVFEGFKINHFQGPDFAVIRIRNREYLHNAVNRRLEGWNRRLGGWNRRLEAWNRLLESW
jgi:hypothetical protein